ncbi:MAG: alkaline phosphatase [Bacteroidia bacterium]|nr:alkaline phosphatase [Bacteroidia bacterium]
MRFIGRILAAVVLSMAVAMPVSAKKEKAPKYVFYMIGDGMGINEVFGTELYNQATGFGPAQINFAHFPNRTFVTTFSASSLVTDSSAAGTALATGVKTTNNYLGVDSNYNPVSSVAEWAHKAGFGTGVASSVGMNHATPAAFYGHVKDRDFYEEILQQYIDTDAIDFAAGSTILTEKKKTGHTALDMIKKVREAGITVLVGHDEFKNLAKSKGRVLCISTNEGDLTPAINRRGGETKLSHFVTAGIDYLYGHFAKKGFFFMVEGGAIDHAGHNADAAADFQEVTDFAEAMDIVLDFYNQHPNETLIVVTADHETGALMLGAGQYSMNPGLIAAQKYDEGKLTSMYNELKKDRTPSWDEVKNFLKANLGLWDTIRVSERQEATFKSAYDREFGLNPGDTSVQSLYSTTSRMVSDAIDYANKQAGFLMPHGVHTGSPVGLFTKGACASRFMECTDNTDIPKMIKAVAGY